MKQNIKKSILWVLFILLYSLTVIAQNGTKLTGLNDIELTGLNGNKINVNTDNIVAFHPRDNKTRKLILSNGDIHPVTETSKDIWKAIEPTHSKGDFVQADKGTYVNLNYLEREVIATKTGKSAYINHNVQLNVNNPPYIVNVPVSSRGVQRLENSSPVGQKLAVVEEVESILNKNAAFNAAVKGYKNAQETPNKADDVVYGMAVLIIGGGVLFYNFKDKFGFA